MVEKIFIVGNGGHARALATRIGSTSDITFIVNNDPEFQQEKSQNGLITEKEFFQIKNVGYKVFNGIGIPSNSLQARENVRKIFQDAGIQFNSYLSGHAIIDESVQIDPGVQIFENSYLGSNVAIGRDSIISVGAIVEHDCEISTQVFIGPGAIICGGVSISRMSIIGAGAIILPGAKIGQGQVVPSGTRVG